MNIKLSEQQIASFDRDGVLLVDQLIDPFLADEIAERYHHLFRGKFENDLIEYQFSNTLKLMTGLGMGESIQEKVLKELSANLASLMVVEN